MFIYFNGPSDINFIFLERIFEITMQEPLEIDEWV
jgi:hypothetical protein